MYAKRNLATLNDDYLQIKSAEKKEFFSIDRVTDDIGYTNPTIA